MMQKPKNVLPPNTQAIVTEKQVRQSDHIERCRLMREIVRGARYCPSPDRHTSSRQEA